MPDNVTPESIAAEILAALAGKLDTREGSYTAELTAPVALAIYKLEQRMQAAKSMFYIDETSGPYLDEQGRWYGIVRKPGAKSAVQLAFSGDEGTLVPQGSSFTTLDGLRFATLADAVLPAQAPAQALGVGERYNVKAGKITQQYISVPGVTAVTNPAPAQGGADTEGDAALFARIDAYRKKPTNGSNANQYEQWAMEMDGVGRVKVLPLKNGPGSVGILLADPDGGPVDEATVAAVAAHIENLREIGVAVEVASAHAFMVNITAAVQLAPRTTPEQVRTALTKSLEDYLRGITFTKSTIPYNRVAYMLLDIDGVENYTELTINGTKSDVPIVADAAPVLGVVAVT